MQQGGRPGGPLPPQIFADQKRRQAAAARHITTGPPGFLTLGASLPMRLLVDAHSLKKLFSVPILADILSLYLPTVLGFAVISHIFNKYIHIGLDLSFG